MKNKNISWWYLLILFPLSYLLQLVIFYTGGVKSNLFAPLAQILMWFPAIIAIFFRLISKEGFRNVGWGLGKWWYILFAIFVPLLVVLGSAFLLVALKRAILSSQLFIFKNGMVEVGTKVGLVLGTQTQSIAFFSLNFIISIIIGSLIGGIFTFGEEFGWRGYLQEKLLRKIGLNRGLIFLGAIWGYWHLPVILMGYNFPNYPVLGALLLMPISTIFMGIFEGWIYLRSRSIWMPVLAHASVNVVAGIFFQGMIMHQSKLFQHFVWLTVWAFVAALCLISMNRKKPFLWQGVNATADNTA